MSSNLKKCIGELHAIAKIKNPGKRKKALAESSCKSCMLKAMREITNNVVKKNVPLTKSQKRKLLPHAKTIKALSCKTTPRTRKKHFKQSGGFLPVLIPIITELIGNLINNE